MNHIKQILTVKDYPLAPIEKLLHKYHLATSSVEDEQTIPGSFWGESEAGLIKNTLYFRSDTPIHSILHECCHYICMDSERRNSLNTNAGGSYDEENAVCYLQILLANNLPELSSDRIMKDMDSWGYTFRLGSARAWFENDAEDALLWLQENHLLDSTKQPNYQLRID